MRRRAGHQDRSGWAKAPPVVEAEIRAVWQEDELPDELTKAPGFRPFTLGLDAQEWVDSMSDVVDGGDGVYGRPKPAIATQHRQLATSSPAPRPLDVRQSLPVPPPRPVTPSKPRILMPDIDDAPPRPGPVPKQRPLMPDISAPEAVPTRHTSMPDIGKSTPQPNPGPRMPDIDGPESAPARRTIMPDIDAPPSLRRRTLPKRVSMPDIGEEQQATNQPPQTMPEIG